MGSLIRPADYPPTSVHFPPTRDGRCHVPLSCLSRYPMTSDDLIYVPVGGNRYRAHLIAEACRAEGIRVELLTGDDSGVDPHLGFIQGHRLLIRSVDESRVTEIVARS